MSVGAGRAWRAQTTTASWSDEDVLGILWRHRALGQSSSQLAATFGTSRSAICGLVHRVEVALKAVDLDALTDNQLLVILDEVERRGRSAEVVAKEFALTRSAILALVHQVRLDLFRAGPDAAVGPENRDGGMPELWWTKGLWAREVAA